MTAKIAISLPDHLVDAARKAVENGEAASVSAFVAAAIERSLERQELAVFLAELDRELGPPSARDMAWAARALRVE